MIGLNRHWQSVVWREGEKPLVVHYAGCSFCSPPTDKVTEKQVRPCLSSHPCRSVLQCAGPDQTSSHPLQC